MATNQDLLIPPLASTFIGAISGSVEVIIQQPSIAIKNAIQSGRRIPFDICTLYRGVMVNAGSMAPINGIQFGVNEYLEQKLAARGELSDGVRTVTATVAGAVSGLLVGPAELVMIQQQKNGTAMSAEIKDIYGRHGLTAFLKGMNPTLVRESIFTGAYLGVIPILRERMVATWPQIWSHNSVAVTAAASVVAGVTATVLTQPFDTIKTQMQANLGLETHRTMSATASMVMRKGGMKVLFRGIIPRTQRVTCSIFILSEAKDRLFDVYLNLVATEFRHR